MDRCHLKGSEGDALHAVLCAAGYNIRWLLRMIARKGMGLLLCLLQVSGLTDLFEKLAEIFGLNRLQNLDKRWVLA
jgi:IS5 family transposase